MENKPLLQKKVIKQAAARGRTQGLEVRRKTRRAVATAVLMGFFQIAPPKIDPLLSFF
jgi:hypothetical protein